MIDLKKVEFVRNTYPHIHKVNPYIEFKFVDEVKERLMEAGLYQQTSKHVYNDTTIINIILAAQGKRVFNRRVSPRGKKYA